VTSARTTVVILTHDRPDEAGRTIARTLALPEAPPLVVVDNGSRNGTAAALAARRPAVDVVALPQNVGGAGRNVGVARARTPYVALSDDDCWWAPGAVAHAETLLDAHPRLAVVSARILVGPDEELDPTCARMAASPLGPAPGLPGVPILGFMAGAAVVRRSAFLAAGGFERRLFLGGEEAILAIDLAAAGWAMAYVDALVVHHHPSQHRDPGGRSRHLARNALWLAWLRRPARSAARATAGLLRASLGDGAARRGVLDAARGLPWALRHRRVVPREVESVLRLLDASGAGLGAIPRPADP